MFKRSSRAAMVLTASVLATTVGVVGQVPDVQAASFSFSIATGGSIGNVGIDAIGGGYAGGGEYDSYLRWDSGGGITKMTLQNGYYQDAPGQNAFSIPGSPTSLRLELYPKPTGDVSVPYDIWSGSFGGAAAERSSRIGYNFGNVPLPTVGVDGAFRIDGAVVSSTPVADGRVKVDLFQIPCGFPDTCIDTKYTNTGTSVGAFASGASRGNRWSGSVGWPGHYIVFVEDTATGRKVRGFMDIADGQVPAIDLDVACFGILRCTYDFGNVPVPSGGFHPVSPTRILDTRFGLGINNGALRPGDGRLGDPNPINRRAETRNHELKVTGVGGIPSSGVSAVLLNVTAVDPPSFGYVSVSPRPAGVGDVFDDQNMYGIAPSTSNLNLTGGETVPNLVLARVGAGGTIRFTYAGYGPMNVIADVAGWYDTGAPDTMQGGLGFTGLTTPMRLLDTRNGIGDSIGRYQHGDDRVLKVAGVAGVPTDAQSVVLNVTAAGSEGIGFVTVYPDGQGRPNASNLNANPGQTRSNMVVVKVGTAGSIRLATLLTDTDLIVDVFGYYGGRGGKTTAVDPVRIADSRTGLGTSKRAFGPAEARNIQVAGAGGVPANATAVMLNVTAAETDSWGWLTVWPTGGQQPNSSNLNWVGGKTVPNMVMVALGANGQISIYNDLGHAQVLVDVFAYVT